MLNIFFAFTAALLLLTSQCSAQPASPPPPPPVAAGNDSKEYLEAHNQARAQVGCPLQWSQPLAKIRQPVGEAPERQTQLQFCKLGQQQIRREPAVGRGFRVTPRAAVETWVAEKKFYNYQDNSCAPDHRCGVYTQVVWKQSVELGCAQAGCAKDQSSLTICFYNPPGNIIGEKPY
ncbi:UNVERIFIED_CONTAM: STS14 protein [Sesamum radiatum]|uniref:STS14 protein n=1 Tax=Sesamum radiatum TaxID=300843 RepID=A0AAW2P612_SESRA